MDVSKAIGKVIANVGISQNELTINFTDDAQLVLFDDAQWCCEYRYMNCDDDLTAYAGATFYGAELRDGPVSGERDYDVTECQFLIVDTSEGSFTVANYNEHNGYYGGFDVKARFYGT